MKPCLAEDNDPCLLMQQDVMVKWEYPNKSDLPHNSQRVPQHENQEHHRVEVQTDPVRPCQHDPEVGAGTIDVFEGGKDEASRNEEAKVDRKETDKESE